MSNKLPKKRNDSELVIKINDGRVKIPIKNQFGETIGNIVFAPTDTNIVDRYEEVVRFWKNYKMPEDDSIEAARKAEKEIAEKMSYLINGDAEKAFFQVLGPFSPMDDGRIFLEIVIDSVAKVIETKLNTNVTKVQRRVNKYVAKYHN